MHFDDETKYEVKGIQFMHNISKVTHTTTDLLLNNLDLLDFMHCRLTFNMRMKRDYRSRKRHHNKSNI